MLRQLVLLPVLLPSFLGRGRGAGSGTPATGRGEPGVPSGAFVPCCRDICLLSHPSPEPQGSSQCHPVLPSLPPSPHCLRPLAKRRSSPRAWTAIALRPGLAGPLCLWSAWVGAGGTGRPRVCGCECAPARVHACTGVCAGRRVVPSDAFPWLSSQLLAWALTAPRTPLPA